MVVLFIVGESLPIHIVPPQVAIIGASLALLVAYGVRVEPVGAVIRDVDWKTLVFLGAIFTLVRPSSRPICCKACRSSSMAGSGPSSRWWRSSPWPASARSAS